MKNAVKTAHLFTLTHFNAFVSFKKPISVEFYLLIFKKKQEGGTGKKPKNSVHNFSNIEENDGIFVLRSVFQ